MICNPNQFSFLKDALDNKLERDSGIWFHCSDGNVQGDSTLFKIFSPVIRNILTEPPLVWNGIEITILLPDISVTHIAHLICLVTTGSSHFPTKKVMKYFRI